MDMQVDGLHGSRFTVRSSQFAVRNSRLLRPQTLKVLGKPITFALGEGVLTGNRERRTVNRELVNLFVFAPAEGLRH
jgi:hypothetical protein